MSSQSTLAPRVHAAEQSLGAAGYRLTRPRRELLRAIAAMPDHFTPDELIHAVGPAVGRATVFRTIRMLTERDLLCRVRLEDGTLAYRWSGAGHHHHLVCVSCGRVDDLQGCDIDSDLARLAAASGFAVDGHWLEVYGRCADCRAREA